MTRDPLNFFQPFENLPPNHENQLTRAFLLVLRLSPIAHEYWLARTGTNRRLAALPSARFNTQRRWIALTVEDTDEPIPLISIFLAPNAPSDQGTADRDSDQGRPVTDSDRMQVLDAIIEYPGEFVVVIEDKITDADDWEALYINLDGANVKPIGPPVHVAWPDVLADINGILERRLVAGTEYEVLSDFLAYVDDHFPNLGPYQTLGLCARNEFRVSRRLRSVLADATGKARIDRWGPCCDLPGPGGKPGAGGVGKRVTLRADKGVSTIALTAYPADTLTQAKTFYTRPNTVSAVRELADEDGWVVGQNFHFGHFETGLVWTRGEIDADSYIDLWIERISTTGSVRRDDWPKYLDWLIETGIAIEDDRENFNRHFTDTARSSATPRPGLTVSRQWSIGDAETLDAGGKFTGQVRDAFAILAGLSSG